MRYLWERSSLYEQVGEHKQAMDGYRRILTLLPPTDGEPFMQLSRDMAKCVSAKSLSYTHLYTQQQKKTRSKVCGVFFAIRSYYESNDLPSAISVMEEALSRHPELVTHECVNMAAELYIANHQYGKAFEVRICRDFTYWIVWNLIFKAEFLYLFRS